MIFEEVQAELLRRIASDGVLRLIGGKVAQKKANFEDTSKYAHRLSAILGEVLSAAVSESDKKGERFATCQKLLEQNYTDINELLQAVQRVLDEEKGLQLSPLMAAFPSERVERVAGSLEDDTVELDVIRRRAAHSVETVARSFHDDYMKKNAGARGKAGLKVTVERHTTGQTTCAWCAQVAGKYNFSGAAKGDVFRRHDNCDCVLTYDSSRTRSVLSGDGKAWHEIPDNAPTVRSRGEAQAVENEVLTRRAERGTIQSGQPLRISMQFFAHRNSEDMPTVRLSKQEYAHVMSEIATHLTDSDKTSPVFVKRIGNYQYTVENNGFGNYRIIAKRKIKNG